MIENYDVDFNSFKKGYDVEANTLELQKLMKIATGATMMKRE